MPLGGKRREQGGEVVLTGDDRQSRADRAAGVVAGARKDLRTPPVTTLAEPCGLLLTAVGNGMRRQRQIRRLVPLSKQLGSIVFDAIIVKSLPQGASPLFTPFRFGCGQNQYFVYHFYI